MKDSMDKCFSIFIYMYIYSLIILPCLQEDGKKGKKEKKGKKKKDKKDKKDKKGKKGKKGKGKGGDDEVSNAHSPVEEENSSD